MPEPALMDDRAIVAARGPRHGVTATRPYAYHVESEYISDGVVEDVATVFITNSECPFRCLMCDLWKNTTAKPSPEGAVAEQVAWALGELAYAPHVKLYNSGNFFDSRAVPNGDVPRIAKLLAGRRTVIVECHPKLIDHRCVAFAESLGATRLQVAMGLETVDPVVLPKLNKRMTLDDYKRATGFLLEYGIDVRAFILVRAPFQSEAEGVHWAMRSMDFAFSIGVECCVVIPVRSGNGIMDQLQSRGLFTPPSLRSLEAVMDYGLGLAYGRVFADTWDVEQFFDCARCGAKRADRLGRMNLTQRIVSPVLCACDRKSEAWQSA